MTQAEATSPLGWLRIGVRLAAMLLLLLACLPLYYLWRIAGPRTTPGRAAFWAASPGLPGSSCG